MAYEGLARTWVARAEEQRAIQRAAAELRRRQLTAEGLAPAFRPSETLQEAGRRYYVPHFSSLTATSLTATSLSGWTYAPMIQGSEGDIVFRVTLPAPGFIVDDDYNT